MSGGLDFFVFKIKMYVKLVIGSCYKTKPDVHYSKTFNVMGFDTVKYYAVL